MITVYSLIHNEELLMQFMIDHYRSRFPNCHIVIYDNSSTDKSVEIAKHNGCDVRPYGSDSLDDGLHAKMKSSVWKDATTDWVYVSDFDELMDINEDELKYEESIGTTIIKAEAWTMVNMEDSIDPASMTFGLRDGGYDKCVLFNKRFITDINYGVGCHSCNPTGTVKFGSKSYTLHHYRDMHPDITVQKSQLTAKRLSAANRSHGWGVQCLRSEDELRKDFARLRGIAGKVPPRR